MPQKLYTNMLNEYSQNVISRLPDSKESPQQISAIVDIAIYQFASRKPYSHVTFARSHIRTYNRTMASQTTPLAGLEAARLPPHIPAPCPDRRRTPKKT